MKFLLAITILPLIAWLSVQGFMYLTELGTKKPGRNDRATP